ncbi:hypothetical protein Mesau_05848 [Mesorhizobium australicum WSM2073]|uniref:Uncharacterized protein n=1 Tax=Mesorhizobium australicum (strain HAMBI 3006 / LMG 24608 / WSM2073) TaxID=754035 RepID=L0KVS7_MESAW|nr:MULTISPECIES: hypothetical protein [Mesorhizobium]AGB48084.1 hypothetical protein Mesau_05848 [Mesorhizobium australicum WSM2073]
MSRKRPESTFLSKSARMFVMSSVMGDSFKSGWYPQLSFAGNIDDRRNAARSLRHC